MFAFGAMVPMLGRGIHQHFQATQECQIVYNFQDFSRNLYQIVSKQTDSISRKEKNHSLIRVVLIQSCSAGAENFTNYVFCHPQFSGVIQNIENRCAIKAKI